jgi:5-methylthioribose kinase
VVTPKKKRNMFILNANEPELAAYLQQLKWKDERTILLSNGGRNMKLCAETATRSFIVKQSRGYVEK